MSSIQEGASLNPGDEEDFIRQLQAQLAGEAAAASGTGEGSAEGSPLGDMSAEMAAADAIGAGTSSSAAADLLSNKPQRGNVIVQRKQKGLLSQILMILKFFAVPTVIGVVLFFLSVSMTNPILKCVVFIIAGILTGFYILFISRHEAGNQTVSASSILNEVAKGKLSFNIQDDPELKEALGSLANPIDNVIKELSDMVTKFEMSVLDMVGNSDALSYFATSMANKTDQQEASVQKIDSSAMSMNESMQNIRQSVESAYQNTKTSIVEADNSSVEILSLIKEMNTISEMSEKITATMKLISDIADETNLLALNASIQSAHAGEEGKGFGVVASEIRNLAESSSKATKSIYQTIETTVDSITKGVAASEKAKKALAKIVSSIKSTEDIMSDISKAINTQSETTNGLKDSVSNIGELTKNINNDTQNMKAAIANLSGQAQILNTIIKGYEVNQASIKSDVIFGVE